MGKSYLTRVPKSHKDESIVPSTNVLVKLGTQIQRDYTGSSYQIKKNEHKWIKNLNIRPEVIKQ